MKTKIKTPFALLMAALSLISILSSQKALADIPDQSCGVELEKADGTVLKQIVDRQAQVYLYDGRKPILVLNFQAKVYSGGPDTVPAVFLIKDANDDSQTFAIFTSEIGDNWNWKFDVPTAYGPMHVHCY